MPLGDIINFTQFSLFGLHIHVTQVYAFEFFFSTLIFLEYAFPFRTIPISIIILSTIYQCEIACPYPNSHWLLISLHANWTGRLFLIIQAHIPSVIYSSNHKPNKSVMILRYCRSFLAQGLAISEPAFGAGNLFSNCSLVFQWFYLYFFCSSSLEKSGHETTGTLCLSSMKHHTDKVEFSVTQRRCTQWDLGQVWWVQVII